MKEIDHDLLWQLFLETGDPLCWLEYRRQRAGTGREGKGDEAPFRR